MNGYVLGLVSVSFRQHSPEEIIKAAADAGLKCIEWGSDVHARVSDTAMLERIAELQREYGLYCSSYGSYFRLGVTPTEELEGYISAARRLGAGIVRIWAGSKSGAVMTADERLSFVEECKRAARIAEAHGITLSTECHKDTFTEHADDTIHLINEVGSAAFRTYWQPFQWLEHSENLNIARQLSPYTEHIHVFNWRGGDKLPLAQAVGEWRAYLGEFSRPRTLLLEFMPDGKISSLQDEADSLRTIIEESI